MEDDIQPESAADRTRIRYWIAVLAVVTATLLWSGNFIVGRSVHSSIDPVALAFWRHAVACAILVPYVLRQVRRHARALAGQWHVLTAMAVSGIVVFNIGTYSALQTVPAVRAVMLLAFVPMLVLLLARLLPRTSLSRTQIAAVLLSTAGVAVIAWQGGPRFLTVAGIDGGTAWMLAAVLGFAVHTVLVRRLPAALPTLLVYAVTVLIGTVCLALVGLPELSPAAVFSKSATTEAVLYLALGPSIVAYFCWIYAIRALGAPAVGNCMSLVPLFGTSLGVSLLGERLTATLAIGGALVLGGIVLSLALPALPWDLLRASRRVRAGAARPLALRPKSSVAAE